MTLVVLLGLIAPGEMTPLHASNQDMLHWAESGHFPLVEEAKREGRPALAVGAMIETFAALALLFAVAAFFGMAGFRSLRARGWSNAFWIVGVCVICLTPSIFPGLTLYLFDYAITSSENVAGGGVGASEVSPLNGYAQIYGAEGVNRHMTPSVFLIERGLVAALLAGLVAVCCHDLGYRLREALEDFGLIAEEEKERVAKPRRPQFSTAGAGAGAGQDAGAGPRFGQRDDVASPRAMSDEARACTVLGVRVGASKSEIERAFRQKMKRAHPDHGGTAAQAAALNAARDSLLRR